MAEQGALWETRGARGVLDHHGIVGTDGGQLDALVVARRNEGVPVVEADHLAQLGAVRLHRLYRLQHRIAAKIIDHEHAGGARLLQHILHLVGAEGRVHGDQHHACHPGAELQHHPFREVLRPDRDALALLETRGERAGGALRLPVQLRVGPLPPLCRIGDAGNQRQAIGRRLGRLAQEVAERHLPHRRRGRSRDVRHRQGHLVLPGPLLCEAASFDGKMPLVGEQCKPGGGVGSGAVANPSRHCEERSDEATQFSCCSKAGLLRGGLSPGAHSRDPLARNDGGNGSNSPAAAAPASGAPSARDGDALRHAGPSVGRAAWRLRP